MLGWDRDRSEVGLGLGSREAGLGEGVRQREGQVGGLWQGRQRLYFSRVPVADAVHGQGLLGWGPALRQRGYLLALLLQLPNGLLGHGQLLLFCLSGAQAVEVQARWHWRPPTPCLPPKRTRAGFIMVGF